MPHARSASSPQTASVHDVHANVWLPTTYESEVHPPLESVTAQAFMERPLSHAVTSVQVVPPPLDDELQARQARQ